MSKDFPEWRNPTVPAGETTPQPGRIAGTQQRHEHDHPANLPSRTIARHHTLPTLQHPNIEASDPSSSTVGSPINSFDTQSEASSPASSERSASVSEYEFADTFRSAITSYNPSTEQGSSYFGSYRLHGDQRQQQWTASASETVAEEAELREIELYLRQTLNIPEHLPVDLEGIRDLEGPPEQRYQDLVALAIFSSPHQRLSLQGIYDALEEHFTFFRMDKKAAWKRSIRHLLSQQGIFVKSRRPVYERGKGSLWALDISKAGTLKRARKRGKRPNVEDEGEEWDGGAGAAFPGPPLRRSMSIASTSSSGSTRSASSSATVRHTSSLSSVLGSGRIQYAAPGRSDYYPPRETEPGRYRPPLDYRSVTTTRSTGIARFPSSDARYESPLYVPFQSYSNPHLPSTAQSLQGSGLGTNFQSTTVQDYPFHDRMSSHPTYSTHPHWIRMPPDAEHSRVKEEEHTQGHFSAPMAPGPSQHLQLRHNPSFEHSGPSFRVIPSHSASRHPSQYPDPEAEVPDWIWPPGEEDPKESKVKGKQRDMP